MDTINLDYPFFDMDGFMQDADDWSVDIAQRIAALDGVGPLTESQLIVLKTLRKLFGQVGGPPALSHVCHMGGFQADCMNRLFPSAREAWRIAGLPNPGDEAVSYL